MIILKEYQQQAIHELHQKAKEFLEKDLKTVIFKSPTGSGKTLMLAEFLRLLSTDDNLNVSYIWATPRPKLANQSWEKLTNYFLDKSQNISGLTCSFFDDLSDNYINRNEILFLNWESINKDNNIIIVENEREFYLNKIIQNTKDRGRKIILIIDESHHTSQSEISKDLRRMMKPTLVIGTSATPKMSDPDYIVNVAIEDVKSEGMIKKSVILNDGIKDLFLNNKEGEVIVSDSLNHIVIDRALEKRNEIIREYKKLNLDINPLVLLQLPDRSRKEIENQTRNDIQTYLNEKYDINAPNGKLAIWLSEEKVNLSPSPFLYHNKRVGIESNSSEVEVLLFKHAPALGWDCPRAHILVLFKDWKSISFTVQIIGRIMRMPDPIKGHFDNAVLDNAYVYTNVEKISVQDDMPIGYLNLKRSKRQYKTNFKLESCYSKRQREQTRLDSHYEKIFEKSSKSYSLENKIDTNVSSFNRAIITDTLVDNIDKMDDTDFDQLDFGSINIDDLQIIFNQFIIDNLNPFSPEARSIDRIKNSIYKFFKQSFNYDFREEDGLRKIVLSVLNNQEAFINVLDLTQEKYLTYISKKKSSQLIRIQDWDIKKELLYSTDVEQMDSKKSLFEPFYYNKLSGPEKSFINFLEKNKNVTWWFKNGEGDRTYFAIPYTKGSIERPFYIDFIIKDKNGKYYFVDTKSGFTISEAKEKIQGLIDFTKRTNHFAALVANTDDRDYEGSWKFWNKNPKLLKKDSSDLSNWDYLEI